MNTELVETGVLPGVPSVRSLQSSINVEKEDVERHEGEGRVSGGYECQCHAWSSTPDKTAVSRKALVEVACEYCANTNNIINNSYNCA